MQLKLEYEEFKDWLESLEPSEYVSKRMEECPVKTYLRTQGAERPLVGGITYGDSLADMKLLPPWAVKFISNVDFHPNCYWDQLTAEECLRLLERAIASL